MASAPLLTLRYRVLDDVAQDLDMVIQSSPEDEWSWEGASLSEREAWLGFVQRPSSLSALTEYVPGLTGKIQVLPGVALRFSLLSQSPHTSKLEAAVDVSAPSLAWESIAKIRSALIDRSKQWEEDGIDSLFFFDLLATAQTLLGDKPDLLASQNDSNIFNNSPKSDSPSRSTDLSPIELSRAMFWSHHLIAPSKLKDFNNWCPELSLWGVLRAGYPGYLCFEGEKEAVDEMVRRVKGLQWHAIQLRVQRSWTCILEKDSAKTGTREQALLSCALAKNHSDNKSEEQDEGEKLRTGCEVIENLGEFVERLKGCGLELDEVEGVLGIKVSGGGH
ncbi:uncharacterized protein MEPE_00437 [Melanopsichium pennsylvanicum]|uniref:Small nuclear ribonucleoprotein Prp3 C-terminal domain-containing protein n=2 Tax=Melanopsichium pennsylvanicum TaxID=63383 RepID=A0AAJ4XGM0_9BASI|nr:conserved hypothetical protein [Melanopsichium pennsylvanicum 4]SNX81732.1 uncharacterized protein MEPE_00437 [Melanopsichium pennsylvanicum]